MVIFLLTFFALFCLKPWFSIETFKLCSKLQVMKTPLSTYNTCKKVVVYL